MSTGRIVYVDNSDESYLVICTMCSYQDGPWIQKPTALASAAEHRNWHDPRSEAA